MCNCNLYPTASLRDDSSAVQNPVTFFALDKEINSRASMQLTHYDPNSTIDDKLSAAYHNRHFAKIYCLL